MRDHYVWRVNYTQRRSQGEWMAHDEYRHHSYGPTEEFSTLYVAPSEELVRAHFNYWAGYHSRGCERTLVSVERLGQPTVIEVK